MHSSLGAREILLKPLFQCLQKEFFALKNGCTGRMFNKFFVLSFSCEKVSRV